MASQSPPSKSTRRLLTREEWEELKPIIRDLYLQKGWKYIQIAEHLRHSYDFEPTHNQFKKRIKLWGFEKNFRKADRNLYLSSSMVWEDGTSFAAGFLRGRAVSEMKAKRWKKKNKTNDTEQSGSPGGSEASFRSAPNIRIDVVNSSGFTELIGALTITCCSGVQPLSFNNEDTTAIDTILSIDRRQVPNATDKISTYNELGSFLTDIQDINLPRLTRTAQRCCLDHPKASKYEYNLPDSSKIFDSLSPFPKHSSVSFREPKVADVFTLDNARILEPGYWRQFRIIKSMTPPQITRLADSMRKIADTYAVFGKSAMAEAWYRRVVTAKQLIPHYKPLQTLEACMGVIKSTCRGYRYTEARALLEDFNQKVQTLLPPEHRLAIEAKQKWSVLLFTHRSFQERDVTQREILQTCLNNFGVQHLQTIKAMKHMASDWIRSSSIVECETMIRISIEIMLEEEPALLNRWTIASSELWELLVNLSRNLYRQHRYLESQEVLDEAWKRYGFLVVKGDFRWYQYLHEKSYGCYALGKLEESEYWLLLVLTYQEQENCIVWLASSESLLGRIFLDRGRLSEGCEAFERRFNLIFHMYSLIHEDCMRACRAVGYCYAQRGQYGTATEIFERAIEDLSKEKRMSGYSECDRQRCANVLKDCIAQVEMWRVEEEARRDAES